MAVEIAWDPIQQVACMWDNTTDTAFGPVFSGPSADTEAQEFLDWLKDDPRQYAEAHLQRLAQDWCEFPTVAERDDLPPVRSVDMEAVKRLEDYAGEGRS